MPDEEPLDIGQVIITEEGTLTPEEFARREAAAAEVGGLGAPERIEDAVLLEQERRRVEERTHGDLGSVVETGLRQAAAGATFGVSNLLLSSEQRERARIQNRTNETTAALSELSGGLVPGLFVGGTGAAATLARLTPAGRTAALAGRVASGGRGLVGRVLSGAAAGAIEGAAQGVGAHLARETLEENPDFSAESLAGAAGLGLLLGGGVGGGIGLGTEAGRAIRGRLARKLARESGEPIDPALFGALDEPERLGVGGLADGDGFFVTRRAGTVRQQAIAEDVGFSDVVSRKTREGAADAWGSLAGHIDNQGNRAMAAQVDDLGVLASGLDNLQLAPATRQSALDAMEGASTRHLQAANEARAWLSDAADELGDINLATTTPEALSKALPDELEHRGALVLAQLDETGTEMSAIQQSLSEAIAEGNQLAAQGAAPEAIQGGLGSRIRAIAQGRGGVRRAAETVLGASEFAAEVGVDVPGVPSVRDIPVIGEALSLWVKFRAGTNAAQRVGVLPSSPTTRAAAAVNLTRQNIASAVGRIAASAAARKVASRSAPVVARQIEQLRSQSPEAVAERAHATVAASPELAAMAGATAQRAHQYLLDNAPENPLAGVPGAPKWQPNETQREFWQRRVDAVASPVSAVKATLKEPFPDLEAEVLREVYPQIYEAARSDLIAQSDDLVKKLPLHRREAIGRAYHVPLTISQMPGYPTGHTVAPTPTAPQPTDLSRGPGPTRSPSVTTEMTGDEAAARGRV